MRRAAAALALALGLAVALGACAEGRRSLGEACLKDTDCLSGICSQLACAAGPPLLDAEVDATEDGATSAGDAGDAAPPDTGTGGDAADGASTDAPADVAAQ